MSEKLCLHGNIILNMLDYLKEKYGTNENAYKNVMKIIMDCKNMNFD